MGSHNSCSKQRFRAFLTSGVPDFYQGTELWDLTLVDPDNRRPIDFDHRVRLLSDCCKSASWRETMSDGSAKFALTRRLLNVRTEAPELFSRGRYVPMDVVGHHRKHVIAFARVLDGDAIFVAVGRHLAPFTQGGRHWPMQDAIQAEIKLQNFRIEYDFLNAVPLALERSLPVSAVFRQAPVAVLRARGL
jgi:(1->4)-alpha-D-glucan 1-alpha-D-glucosylmutase